MLIGTCTAIGGQVALLDSGYSISHPYKGAFLGFEGQKNWGEVPICMASSNRWAQTICQ